MFMLNYTRIGPGLGHVKTLAYVTFFWPNI